MTTEKLSQINEQKKIPLREMQIPRAFYSISNVTNSFIKSILQKKLTGLSIEIEDGTSRNMTPVDFFSLSEDSSDKDLLEFCKNMLCVKKIDSDTIKSLSMCLQPAKEFLEDYLHLSFPKEFQKINELQNDEDLLRILRKTKALGVHDKGFSPMYCALVKTVFAEWHYNNDQFQNLVSEEEYLYKKIFQEDKNGVTSFHKVYSRDDKWDVINVTGDKYSLFMNATHRDKGHNRCLCKFLRKPKNTISQANSDGIGVRFETGNKANALKLVKFLIKYFSDNFKLTQRLKIEHTHFFENKDSADEYEKELVVLAHELNEQGNQVKRRIFDFNENDNPNVNKFFESLSISSMLDLPENGKEGSMVINRAFELQIVEKGNKNESKFSRHEVYEAVQKISAVTRLFGAFSEKYLDMICEEASGNTKTSKVITNQDQVSVLCKEKIKEYILDNHVNRTYVKGGKGVRYTSDEQFNRWLEVGILPNKIYKKSV